MSTILYSSMCCVRATRIQIRIHIRTTTTTCPRSCIIIYLLTTVLQHQQTQTLIQTIHSEKQKQKNTLLENPNIAVPSIGGDGRRGGVDAGTTTAAALRGATTGKVTSRGEFTGSTRSSILWRLVFVVTS